MGKKRLARHISFGGILTAIAVLLQSAPVFFPAIGLLLSPFSTLPVMIAAIGQITMGFIVYFSTFIILLSIHLQEAIIFLFTTGLLGMIIGTFLFRKGILFSILISFLSLTSGILFLTYIAKIPAFGDITHSLPFSIALLLFSAFSLGYVTLWNVYLRKFIALLERRNLLKFD